MDKWARWLLQTRDGGNSDLRRQLAPALVTYRDGVLGRAAVAAGDTVLDVGTGTGLIGFGALERVGPDGQVIFSDISADLLDECRRIAGGDPRCSFLRAPADDLGEVPDASVDVVTTRSVLIYLADKRPAFAEAARVLRPGGRLSVFEPINGFATGRDDNRLFGYDPGPVSGLAGRVKAVYLESAAAESTMLGFDERDLIAWADGAGFTAIELDYRAQVDMPVPGPAGGWDRLRSTAPNPLVPTYAEAMAAALTPDEQDELDTYFRALVAADAPRRSTVATVFLRAIRA